jgi:hypothetical protein
LRNDGRPVEMAASGTRLTEVGSLWVMPPVKAA